MMSDAKAIQRLPANDDFDWSATPLGPMETWSDDLRHAVERAVSDRPIERAPTPAAVLDALFSSAPLGLAIAERHPGRISKLMLVDTLPFYGALFGGPDTTVEKLRPMVAAMKARPAAPMADEAAGQMAAQMVTGADDVARLVGWMKASDPAVVCM